MELCDGRACMEGGREGGREGRERGRAAALCRGVGFRQDFWRGAYSSLEGQGLGFGEGRGERKAWCLRNEVRPESLHTAELDDSDVHIATGTEIVVNTRLDRCPHLVCLVWLRLLETTALHQTLPAQTLNRCPHQVHRILLIHVVLKSSLVNCHSG